jgi:hypothetical protein
MMGLPHQTFQEICDSLIFVHSQGIKIRLASFSPIPGTIDHERAVKDGLFPAEADPLLTNKTIFPLFRTTVAYKQFQHIRQVVRTMNESVEQGSSLFSAQEIKNAFHTITGTF